MRKIEYWIEQNLDLSAATQESIAMSLIALLVLWIVSRVLLRLASRKQTDSRKLYQWKKTTNYVVTGLGIIILANIWFDGFKSITTFLGIFSVGLVVVLRDPILNMMGWVFLIWKRPFKVGDRIKVGPYTGDVIDIAFFQFTLNELGEWVDSEQATGRVVHVPNSQVFTQGLVNYNYGFPFLWHEVQVRVTFESNWQKARAILQEIGNRYTEKLAGEVGQRVRREAQQHLIFYRSFEPRVFIKVQENGIQLTVRYLCNLNGRRESENKIWEDVLTEFLASADIRFAYPTTRFYSAAEGQESESEMQRIVSMRKGLE
ncbi:mechanosensitive ion channel family protein [Pontibacter sp. JH31]|uniref:Mechanosensitive ion channel family protein n=1 Tax=Pontibacter aquaedesilientis TaxID=2766980 RepID=A0ABR7XMK2_9BACT|nr:mechanosensitive ion channel family protein [Pontibacter aquaedesilientis]MBD1398878.1 mechanosensitive ion channel family protein [Pontibacter aquaedesilientis]